jgi:hypothetical protein
VAVELMVGVADADGVLDGVGVWVAVPVGVRVAEGVGVSVGVGLEPRMVSMCVLKLVVSSATAQPTLRSGPIQICAGPMVTSTKIVS